MTLSTYQDTILDRLARDARGNGRTLVSTHSVHGGLLGRLIASDETTLATLASLVFDFMAEARVRVSLNGEGEDLYDALSRTASETHFEWVAGLPEGDKEVTRLLEAWEVALRQARSRVARGITDEAAASD